jgi:hypothetical protein
VEEGEVVVGVAVSSGGDPPSCFQPGVGAFDGPAVAGLRVAGFDTSFFAAPDFAADLFGRDRVAGSAWLADPRLDLALGESLLERGGGVATVCPELVGVDAGGGELVEQWQQVAAFVFVAGGEPDRERLAGRVDG